jgi:hypothetical protein
MEKRRERNHIVELGTELIQKGRERDEKGAAQPASRKKECERWVGSQTDGMREHVATAGPWYLYLDERIDCVSDGTLSSDDIAACTGALRVGAERK